MAILKQRLNKRLSDGSYTAIHLETSSDIVMRPDGTTVEEALEGIKEFDPSTITPESIGAAKSDHDHTLNDMNGVLSVEKGGTGVTSLDALKSAMNIQSVQVGIIAEAALGIEVSWCGYRWIVCHRTSTGVTLAGAEFYEKCQFNSNGSTAYAGSNLASRAKAFENSLPAADLANAVNTTVNGVTAKIFVASYEQITSGFSWFKSGERRVCEYNGTADAYWTSSSYDSDLVYYVNKAGSIEGNIINNCVPTNFYGFRPFVTIKI